MKITPLGKLILVLLGLAIIYFGLRNFAPDLLKKVTGGKPVATGPDLGGGSAPSAPSGAMLRLHGSNTIGAELAPALAQAFLRSLGAQNVRVVPGKTDESSVEGTLPGDSTPGRILIEAHGSATGFVDLRAGSCDIAASSRRVKPDEAAQLAGLGDMTGVASEHVLGLDGVAVIVNQANPVSALTKDQLAQIFSGEVTSWAQIGGGQGPIKVLARDEKSGTSDTFVSLVMGPRTLSPAVSRFEDSRELSDKVSADPGAIGFVGLPYVRGAKAIAVSDAGVRPLLPSRLTVATEDYLLSRRLYLYTPAASSNANVHRFVEFALSKAGQDIVAENGFVAQTVKAEATSVDASAPSDYRRLTASAQRLSLNFRFRTGSSELDNKALVDLDRVTSFIADLRYSGKDVLLFGFADSTGGREINEQLSRERARAVANNFEQRGLQPAVVTGFGASEPIASNDTEEGRERNRRVEIWVRKP